MASFQSLDAKLVNCEPPFNMDGGKSAHDNQVLFSGIVTGIMNKIIIAIGNINFVICCLFCSNIFCVKIVSPIEPKIIIAIDANSSNLTNAELT